MIGFGRRKAMRPLVAAEIEGTKRNRAWRHLIDDGGVKTILFFLAGRISLRQQEVFGPHKPDAFSPLCESVWHVFRDTDIGRQTHAPAIHGFGRHLTQTGNLASETVEAFTSRAILAHRKVSWPNNDVPVVAIDDDRIAITGLAPELRNAADHRHAERGSQESG